MAEDQGTAPADGSATDGPVDGVEPLEPADGAAAQQESDAAEQALTPEETAEVEARTSSRWSDADRARERALLATLAASEPGSPEHAAARDALVTLHLPLVQFLARRFRDRGEPLEDLVQVGTIGLIKAVDRFDIERGVEFSTYATPTVVGEIKRHFRDKGWAIRVPRRLQELRISIGQATATLAQTTGRSPTVAELATHLGLSEDEILEGLEGAQAYSTASLDAQVGGEDDAPNLADRLGEDDAELENIEYRESLKPLIAALPARERRILVLRFFHGMTQSQIAEEIGISQMHVSRLLAKSLAVLRRGLTEDE
jgi:RNA polymerase sigma-B factor